MKSVCLGTVLHDFGLTERLMHYSESRVFTKLLMNNSMLTWVCCYVLYHALVCTRYFHWVIMIAFVAFTNFFIHNRAGPVNLWCSQYQNRTSLLYSAIKSANVRNKKTRKYTHNKIPCANVRPLGTASGHRRVDVGSTSIDFRVAFRSTRQSIFYQT